MTKQDQLRQQLTNLKARDIKSCKFNVDWLLEVLDEKRAGPAQVQKPPQGRIGIDGGKFGIKDED